MSLPAYMYIFDENGQQINGSCLALNRVGAIEVMNSSYGMVQHVDSNTGSLMGSRKHNPFTIHKQIDKTSPYFANALCNCKKLQKAVIHYYDVNHSGQEYEIYRVTLTGVVVMSVNATHAYFPGSGSSNMLESIGLRYAGIEWFYLEGHIKYEDSWSKSPQEQRQ